MTCNHTQEHVTPPASAIGLHIKGALRATMLIGMICISAPAAAVDGCKVLLCLAAPNWRAIPQCVPTINQLLHDLSRGRPFPTCSMSGAGNTAANQWASAPDNCPPQYTHVFDGPNGPIYSCNYTGAVAVNIDGSLWARTWWNMGGESVTEYTPAAKARLTTWDTRFEDDYAVWLAITPPPALPCSTC